MKFVVLAAVCGLSLAAAPALAAEPAVAPTAAAPVMANAHALELARHYVKIMHMDAAIDRSMAKMMPLMIDQLSRSDPKMSQVLTPEFKQALVEVVTEWGRGQTPKVVDKVAELAAQIYSEEELNDLIGFYESPKGQAILAKQPLFAEHTAEVFKSMDLLTGPQVLERVCKKIDCAKTFGAQPDLPKDDHKSS